MAIIEKYIKDIYFIVSYLFLYYAVAGYVLIYLISCCIYELIYTVDKKQCLKTIIYFLFGILVPFIAWRWIFIITLRNAYLYLLPTGIIYKIPFVNILLIAFIPLLLIIFKFLKVDPSSGDRPLSKAGFIQKGIIPLLLLTVITFLASYYSINKKARLTLRIDRFAQEEKWSEIITISKRNPNTSQINAAYTNLALYHTGILPYRIFDFPQVHGEYGLFLKWRQTKEILMPGSDIYFSLGFNNEAYRWAFEALVGKGTSHRTLKRLILTSIIEKDYKVAEKYITVLGEMLFFRDWAQNFKPYLNNDSLVNSDNFFKQKTDLLTYIDAFVETENNDINLLMLLHTNPQNKMAFEYLLSYYLLEKDVIQFAKNIDHIRNFDYPQFPRLYEEAFLIYKTHPEAEEIDLGKYKISWETMMRFNTYAQTYSKYKSNKSMAAKVLKPQFGNTYWYYFHFTDAFRNEKTNNILIHNYE